MPICDSANAMKSDRLCCCLKHALRSKQLMSYPASNSYMEPYWESLGDAAEKGGNQQKLNPSKFVLEYNGKQTQKMGHTGGWE